MRLDEVGAGVNSFPKYIQDQLDEPWSKSTRHESWLTLAYQMVGEQIPDDVVFRELRAWIPDADKADSDLRRAIAGAHRKKPVPASRSISGSYDRDRKIIRFKPGATPIDFEPVKEPVSTIDFLCRMFRPGETICVTNTSMDVNGKLIPANAGTFWTLEKWCEEFGKRRRGWLSGPAGAWIRVNPIKPDDVSGTDASVSDFRYLLVECDGRPKDEQFQLLANSILPIACLIDSGGKSVRAWIELNASSPEEFKERQELVYEYLKPIGIDEANKNPSRFSRLPGIFRGQNEQKFLSWGNGKTWQEFEGGCLTTSFPPRKTYPNSWSE
jgi:hypothetical protein